MSKAPRSRQDRLDRVQSAVEFADWRATFDEDLAEVSPHPFAVVCRANKMVHTRTVSPLPKSYNPQWRAQSIEIRSSDCVVI